MPEPVSSTIPPAGTVLRADCCIVGGGPAGMMLGLLLARAGLQVVVLEKHADFLRDFRGDTIHPSTLENIAELGLLDEFLKRPHQKVDDLRGFIGQTEVSLADLSHLPTRCRFVAFMPQWDFLDFLADEAARYPGFRLLMRTEATDLIVESDRVVGVQAVTPDGRIEVRATLTVGAGGRGSVVRARAGLPAKDLGAPMDVLWMRIPREPADPTSAFGRIDRGRIFVMIPRGSYWQCGFVIRKGGFDELRARGLESFRNEVATAAPHFRDRVHTLADWEDVKLLTVRVDRLTRWYRPGFLCIGDAAHAMSPVGGVGINLAIQDAVAAANLLAEPLRRQRLTTKDLRAVERRRQLPTRLTQRVQLFVQNRVIGPTLAADQPIRPPWPIELFNRFPRLRRIPARMIGIGFRPEHVRTPERTAG